MNLDALIGKNVTFGVSDPWDFGTLCGCGPFHAVITAIGANTLLLTLDKVLKFDGLKVPYLVAKQRHPENPFSELLGNETVMVNLIPLTELPSDVDFDTAANKWQSWFLVGGMGLRQQPPSSQTDRSSHSSLF